MITIADSAIEAVKRLREKEGKPGLCIRLGVQGGGCSGFSYRIDMAEEPKENDQIYEKDGVRVFVDPRSLKLLDGTELVYNTGLAYSGFEFRNPNAKSTCGCGSSFSIT